MRNEHYKVIEALETLKEMCLKHNCFTCPCGNSEGHCVLNGVWLNRYTIESYYEKDEDYGEVWRALK